MSTSPKVKATTKKAKVTEYDEGGNGDGSSSGDGSSDDGEQTKDQISLTKRELSGKIQEGRDEGIDKGRRDVLGTINETLGTGFESVDQLSEELDSKVENPEVVEELQNKLSKKDEKIESYKGKIQDMRTSGKISKNVNDKLGEKKSLTLDVDDIRSLMKNRGYGYTEKNGEIHVTKDGDRQLNDEGNYKTYSEAVIEFAKGKGLIQGHASGGAGGSSSSGSGSVEGNPFETGNVTEQARLYRENPDKYKRLKRAAGK